MTHTPPSPAKQMVYLYPRFYNCSVPAAFLADLPQLAHLCEGAKPPLASDKKVEQLFSVRGDKFVSFVKSERFVDGKVFYVFSWFIFYILPIYLLLLCRTKKKEVAQPLLALKHLLLENSKLQLWTFHTTQKHLSILSCFQVFWHRYSLSGADTLSSQNCEVLEHTPPQTYKPSPNQYDQ